MNIVLNDSFIYSATDSNHDVIEHEIADAAAMVSAQYYNKLLYVKFYLNKKYGKRKKTHVKRKSSFVKCYVFGYQVSVYFHYPRESTCYIKRKSRFKS